MSFYGVRNVCCAKRHLQSWMLPKKRGMKPQKFDYLLALDFEATCLQNEQIKPQEIIEFPCLKINTKSFDVESTFHEYVRPIAHPILSDFCVDLTGINQGTIDNSHDFIKVYELFENWLEDEGLLEKKFALVTCGNWDLKTCLKNQCELSNIDFPVWAKDWINIKKSYKQIMGDYPRSLNAMVEGLGLKFEGKPHSGIDDSQNVANIIKELGIKGLVFEHTSSLFEGY